MSAATGMVEGAPPEVVQYAEDWPLPNRDYSNTRATNDSSIDASNVDQLGLAWTFEINATGQFGGASSNPLILGDTVYFQDLFGNTYALDFETGDVLWAREYNSTNLTGPNGPAVGWDKVFVTKDPFTIAALNATDGEEIWEARLIEDPPNATGEGIDIQPLVYNGLVYTSTVPGRGDVFYQGGAVGIIFALDQESGDVVWNFSTVDDPESIWGNPEVNSGGGAWYPPAVDTDSNITFWAVANPAPFAGTPEFPNGTSRPGPNLYTNSLVALDHADGELLGFTQVLPHDLFDHDFQISPILAEAKISGDDQEIVIGAGKMGRVYAFDRDRGGCIFWIAMVGEHQNDQLAALPEGNETVTVYPGALGGVETPIAYSGGIVYVPYVDLYTNWTSISSLSLGVEGAIAPELQPFDEGTGGLVAIEADTGKILWDEKFDAINVGGATVVNDLVFTATFDGTIYALDRMTGEIVWNYTAPAGINAWPAVANDTIVWPAGVGEDRAVLALRLGENVTPTPTPTPTPTATPTPTPTPRPPPKVIKSPTTIIQTINIYNNISVFIQIIQQTQVNVTLQQDQNFTCFVPTNDAFDNVTAENLSEEDKTKLVQYSCVPGAYNITDLDNVTLTTLEGSNITVDARDNILIINDVAVNVTVVQTANGFVYIIDKVIVPPELGPEVLPTPYPTVTPTITPTVTPTAMPNVTPNVTPTVTPNVTPTVTPTPNVTPTMTPPVPNVTPALNITEPQEGANLSGDTITVSVNVTNFTLVDRLGAANVPGEGHLHYYLDAAVPRNASAPAITAPGTYVPTVNTSYTWANVTPGEHNLSVQLVNNDHTPLIPLVYQTVNVTAEGAAPNVTPTETPSPNVTTPAPPGVVIPNVSPTMTPTITPAITPNVTPNATPNVTPSMMPELPDLIETAQQDGNFTTLLTAVDAAALTDTLRGEGPFTLFAPTDAAFANLSNATVESLLAEPEGDLTEILLYHVVPARINASGLEDGMNLTTVQGSNLTVNITDGVVMVDNASVITADIPAGNGVIHAIDAVLIPPDVNLTALIPTTPMQTPAVEPTPPAGQNVTVDLVAEGIAFDQNTITVPAGANVTMNFENRDEGIPHNFAAYTTSAATEPIFVGEVITGVDSITYTFTAPEEPGTYFFRCDVHPTTMTGSLVVE
ncbi:MAG: fasciclin domain-containing protein [Methanomicrobiales archaeon]|nr:fasciclin domain-containing protein [Methanomicrobiales archaeon]